MPDPLPSGGSATDLAKGYYNKIAAGETSILLPAPVLRRTAYSLTPPSENIANKIFHSVSGFDGGFSSMEPSGYVWLCTADRVVRQGPNGTYERVTEWTGAWYWDTDVYDVYN